MIRKTIQDCTQKITTLLEITSTIRIERKHSSCSTGLLHQINGGGRMRNPYGQQPRAGVVKWALSFGLGNCCVYSIHIKQQCFYSFFHRKPIASSFLSAFSYIEATFLFKAFYHIRLRVFN